MPNTFNPNGGKDKDESGYDYLHPVTRNGEPVGNIEFIRQMGRAISATGRIVGKGLQGDIEGAKEIMRETGEKESEYVKKAVEDYKRKK